MPKVAEFKDFAGGITDQDIPGDTNRYSIGANILLNADKSFYTRPGFDIYSTTAYQLTSTTRVSKLINYRQDTELFAVQGQQFQYLSSGAWTNLLGPGSNKAFNSNGTSALIEEAQWNGHVYACTDSGDPVIKVYRDGFNSLRLRTAGLPAPLTPRFYGSGEQLTAAIALYTDICQQLNDHANDFGSTAAPSREAHIAKDTALDSSTDTLLAALPTTLSGLIADTKTLRTAYNLHIADTWKGDNAGIIPYRNSGDVGLSNETGGGTTNQVYHSQMTDIFGFAGVVVDPVLNLKADENLPSDSNLDTLDEVCRVLNDLKNRYNWHIKAPWTHGNATQVSSAWGTTNPVTAASVVVGVEVGGTTYDYLKPVPAQNVDRLIRYVNYLKAEYNAHVDLVTTTYPTPDASTSSADNSGFYHGLADQYMRCYHADATDLHSCLSVLANIDFHYSLHYQKANLKSHYGSMFQTPATDVHATIFTGDATLASATITNVTPDPTGAGLPSMVASGQNFYIIRHSTDTSSPVDSWMNGTVPFTPPARVSSVTATTIVMDKTANATATYVFVFAHDPVHFDLDRVSGSVSTTEAAGKRFKEDVDLTMTDLSTIVDYAEGIAARLKAHEIGSQTEITDSIATKSIGIHRYPNFTTYREMTDSDGTGYVYIPHRVPSTYARFPSSSDVYGTLSGIDTELDYGALLFENGLSVSNYLYKLVYRYDYTIYDPDATSVSLTANGNSSGEITVSTANLHHFKEGGVLWVDDDNSDPKVGYIDKIYPASGIIYCTTVRDGTTAVDFSGYTTAQNAVARPATLFTDISAPSQTLAVSCITSGHALGDEAGTTARDPISFTNIQALANASNQNYDTSNIQIDVYRTISNGTIFYKTGSVTNGTTTYSDTVLDEDLVNNEQLYTNGGVVENGDMPRAEHIHILDGRMYVAVGNKVYQSLADDPDSIPADFFEQFDEAIVGISSSRSNIVAFSSSAVYRISGVFNELGQGGMEHERIFDKTGLASAQSLVKADNGVFFAGKDGFYFTDGFQCFRVTDLEDTFLSYTTSAAQKNAISGAYDPENKKIMWTIQTTSGGSAPDIMWVLDLQFGIIKEGTPVTTVDSGDSTNFSKRVAYTQFNPTTLAFYAGEFHYGDKDGYIFRQNKYLYSDYLKDTGVAATSWEKRTIFWNYKTTHLDYGNAFNRKYFLRVAPQFKQNGTNLSVQITSDADKGRITDDLPLIRSRKLITSTSGSSTVAPTGWGDTKIDWLSTYYTAKTGNVVDEFRRFKSGTGSLRSNFRSLQFKNAYCVIVASDQMGTVNIANISANVWSLTLVNAASYKWPLHSVDYYVEIGGVQYPVTVRTSDSVIRVSDSGLTALSVQSAVAWEMWGYPKNEYVHMIGYNVAYELIGSEQKDYGGSTTLDGGENA